MDILICFNDSTPADAGKNPTTFGAYLGHYTDEALIAYVDALNKDAPDEERRLIHLRCRDFLRECRFIPPIGNKIVMLGICDPNHGDEVEEVRLFDTDDFKGFRKVTSLEESNFNYNLSKVSDIVECLCSPVPCGHYPDNIPLPLLLNAKIDPDNAERFGAFRLIGGLLNQIIVGSKTAYDRTHKITDGIAFILDEQDDLVHRATRYKRSLYQTIKLHLQK